jgi:hypothetical protein
MQIADNKKRAIMLLEQAIQSLEEELIPEQGSPMSPTVSDDRMSDSALVEIREGIAEVRSQLPILVTSNAVRVDIESDLAQIDTGLERPTPRSKFLKTFLESLRDNLAKAAATGLVALVVGILAESFHMF